jgi:predicted Rossmann fold nucleotide-binding protein DprA/Smf involved in DNA uptake
MHQELSRKLLIWLYRKTCVSWWALEPLLECFLESGWEGLQRTLNQQESVWKYSSRWEEFPMQRKISLERTVEDLRDLLRHAKWEDIENEWSRDNEITVCFVDHNYPERLKQIDDPPPVLWCSRELSFEFWTQAIAVVGSRNSSVYGERVTQHFVHDFVTRYALTVVSGCAVGIDSCAHHACLASGGRTIGVLGTELTKVPHRVRRLFSHPNGHQILGDKVGTLREEID